MKNSLKKSSIAVLLALFLTGCATDSGNEPHSAADEGNVPFSNGPTYAPEEMKGPSGPTP